MRPSRHIVATVMVCHFVAAFAALGMPPFFALILEQSLHSEARFLAGWLYVVPIFFTALSSPWWGRLADRYGKKPLLLRAQLGLAVSFLLAGYAPNIQVFVAALMLQGLLGGTFGASNAYLATVVQGDRLAHSLNLMQWSARAALVIAPAGLGLLITHMASPVELYRYLALLPLLSAALLWRLPPGQATAAGEERREVLSRVSPEAGPWQVYWLQCILVFATVVTFPYFVPYMQNTGIAATPAVAGLLFGLPHLVYLACVLPLGHRLVSEGRLKPLALAMLLLSLSLLGQAFAQELGLLAAWRLVMGLAMTAGMIIMNRLIADVVRQAEAGRTFGWMESSAKWGAVLAGLTAGVVVQAYDTRFPFLIGATVLMLAAGYLAAFAIYRPHPGNP